MLATTKSWIETQALSWMLQTEKPVIMQLERGVNHMIDENGSTYIIAHIPHLGQFKVTVEKLETE